MTQLRIGVAGLHHWYSALPFIQTAGQMENVRIVAIAHDNDAQREEVIEQMASSDVQQYRDPMELVKSADVDLVATFLPTRQNAPVCIAAIEAGKHILSTKPLAFSIEEAQEVANAVWRHKRYFLGYETYQRNLPWVRTVKSLLDSGEFGEVRTISWQSHSGLPRRWRDNDALGWWIDAEQCPGGAWIDHAIYQLDVSRFLLSSEPTQVTGVVGNLCHSWNGLEDYGLASFRFACGAVVNIEDSWVASRPYSTKFSLMADYGWITYDSCDSFLTYFTQTMEEPSTLEVSSQRPNLIQQIAQAIEQAVDGVQNVQESVKNLTWCLRFYEQAIRI